MGALKYGKQKIQIDKLNLFVYFVFDPFFSLTYQNKKVTNFLSLVFTKSPTFSKSFFFGSLFSKFIVGEIQRKYKRLVYFNKEKMHWKKLTSKLNKVFFSTSTFYFGGSLRFLSFELLFSLFFLPKLFILQPFDQFERLVSLWRPILLYFLTFFF